MTEHLYFVAVLMYGMYKSRVAQQNPRNRSASRGRNGRQQNNNNFVRNNNQQQNQQNNRSRQNGRGRGGRSRSRGRPGRPNAAPGNYIEFESIVKSILRSFDTPDILIT